MRIHDPDRAGKTFADFSDADRDRILSTRMNINIVGSSVSPSLSSLKSSADQESYGSQLNAQELRNAKYDGLFKEVSYRLSADALDRWLNWGLFSRQEIAEMRDVEFTSDVLLLTLHGTQSATRKVLDDAYEDYSTEFVHMDASVDRFRSLSDLVETGFALGDDVRRMVTKMWAYSLFDVLQRLAYGGPIFQTGEGKPKRVTVATVTRTVHSSSRAHQRRFVARCR